MSEVLWVDDEELAQALSDKTRVKILLALSKKPQTIKSLSESLGKHRSTVVRHMDKLLAAGLVSRRKIADTYEYSLTELGLRVVGMIEGGKWPASLRKAKLWGLNLRLVLSCLIGLGALLVPVKVHALTRILLFITMFTVTYVLLNALMRLRK